MTANSKPTAERPSRSRTPDRSKQSRWLVILLVPVLLAVLCACVPLIPSDPANATDQDSANTLSPQEAQKEYITLLDTIQGFLPGKWKKDDRPYPDSCGLGSPENTLQFSGGRFHGPVSRAEQAALIEKVTDFFHAQGYKVETIKSPNSPNNVDTTGRGPEGLVIGLGTGDEAITVDGYSRCVPGDASAPYTPWQPSPPSTSHDSK